MSQAERVRLFLDSNVLTAGIVSTWGLDKAVLLLCAARICRLVLAEAVREEVEDNLLICLGGLESGEGNRAVEDYARLIALMKPEIVPYPGQAEVKAARHLIHLGADVPVLLSAITSRPDWFLTHNTKHLTPAVAQQAGLRFATPVELFRALSKSISSDERWSVTLRTHLRPRRGESCAAAGGQQARRSWGNEAAIRQPTRVKRLPRS